jgi:CHAD domain-containing protein
VKRTVITPGGGSASAAAEAALGKSLSAVAKRLGKLRGKKAKRALARARAVHDLRVETRRASAALALYAEFLPPGKARRVEKQLKMLRRAAGEARDLDVLTDAGNNMMGRLAPALLAAAHRRRRKAQRSLVRAARLCRDGDFSGRAEKLLRGLRRRARRNPGPDLAAWSRANLRRFVTAFFAASPRNLGNLGANDASALRTLHHFRVAAKQLRYALEMLSGALQPQAANRPLKGMAEVQRRLGFITDIAAERARFESWKEPALKAELRARLTALDAALVRECRAFADWWTPARRAELRRDFAVLTGAR